MTTCPTCGAETTSERPFCPECGSRLTDTPAAPGGSGSRATRTRSAPGIDAGEDNAINESGVIPVSARTIAAAGPNGDAVDDADFFSLVDELDDDDFFSRYRRKGATASSIMDGSAPGSGEEDEARRFSLDLESDDEPHEAVPENAGKRPGGAPSNETANRPKARPQQQSANDPDAARVIPPAPGRMPGVERQISDAAASATDPAEDVPNWFSGLFEDGSDGGEQPAVVSAPAANPATPDHPKQPEPAAARPEPSPHPNAAAPQPHAPADAADSDEAEYDADLDSLFTHEPATPGGAKAVVQPPASGGPAAADPKPNPSDRSDESDDEAFDFDAIAQSAREAADRERGENDPAVGAPAPGNAQPNQSPQGPSFGSAPAQSHTPYFGPNFGADDSDLEAQLDGLEFAARAEEDEERRRAAEAERQRTLGPDGAQPVEEEEEDEGEEWLPSWLSGRPEPAQPQPARPVPARMPTSDVPGSMARDARRFEPVEPDAMPSMVPTPHPNVAAVRPAASVNPDAGNEQMPFARDDATDGAPPGPRRRGATGPVFSEADRETTDAPSIAAGGRVALPQTESRTAGDSRIPAWFEEELGVEAPPPSAARPVPVSMTGEPEAGTERSLTSVDPDAELYGDEKPKKATGPIAARVQEIPLSDRRLLLTIGLAALLSLVIVIPSILLGNSLRNAEPEPTQTTEEEQVPQGPPAVADSSFEQVSFEGSDGDVACVISPEFGVACQQRRGEFEEPVDQCQREGIDGTVIGLDSNGITWACLGENITGEVVPYNEPVTAGEFTCEMDQVKGVTCSNASGDSFTIAYRDGISTQGRHSVTSPEILAEQQAQQGGAQGEGDSGTNP